MLAVKPLHTGAASTYVRTLELEKLFTWRDRFGERYPAYRVEGETILLPREAVPSGPDITTKGVPIDLVTTFKPRNEDQRRVVDEAEIRLHEGRSFIIQASTGFGKTAICAPLIMITGVKTLVVVPKSDLMKHWKKELEDFLPGVRIGKIQADVCDTVGKDVVIAMLHSVCKPDRYPADIYRQFGLVIFDEVHRLPAEQFSGAAFHFPARLRLGLSATPTRSDGKERLIQAHIGEVEVVANLIPMKPKVLRYHTEWKVPRTGGRQIPHSATKNMHVIKILSRNRQRNQLLAHLIGVCREKNRNVVVFSHLTAHLEALADLARDHGVKSEDVGFYVGSLDGKRQTQKQLETASVKKVVMATYGMLREGTNCPWWDACILATPLGNAKQPVGRILREHPNKKKPAVIDLVDSDSDLFLRYAEGRNRYYETTEIDAEVIDLELPDL